MRARFLTALLTPTLLLLGPSMLTTPAAYAEGTPDGETPANEGVCDDLMFATPGLYGLCVAFCEAQDCEPDFSFDDPFEQCTPSSPQVLDAYNKRKSEVDPEMPCIQQTGCPCWSPEELADFPFPSDVVNGIPICNHGGFRGDFWLIDRPRNTPAVQLQTQFESASGGSVCTMVQDFFGLNLHRGFHITPDEYDACTADVIASGRERGFDCWPEP